jgi:hypothetical protein
MKRDMYRQGDVLIVSDQVPEKAEEIPIDDRIVVAYGEVTGHAHAISKLQARLYAHADLRYLVVSDEGADLTHEEHSTIHLPAGTYRIVHQREYIPQSSRLVLD